MRKRFKRFFSNEGERIKQNYTSSQLSDGIIRLIPLDTTDLQEYINSFAESCSIERILAMCANGDVSALSRVQGAYLDTTVMPKTFRDMLDIVIDGKNKFDCLPIEVKNSFGNDFEKWFSEAGTDEWLNKMGFVKPVENVEKVGDTGAES